MNKERETKECVTLFNCFHLFIFSIFNNRMATSGHKRRLPIGLETHWERRDLWSHCCYQHPERRRGLFSFVYESEVVTSSGSSSCHGDARSPALIFHSCMDSGHSDSYFQITFRYLLLNRLITSASASQFHQLLLMVCYISFLVVFTFHFWLLVYIARVSFFLCSCTVYHYYSINVIAKILKSTMSLHWIAI